jgi:hypothetical protein
VAKQNSSGLQPWGWVQKKSVLKASPTSRPRGAIPTGRNTQYSKTPARNASRSDAGGPSLRSPEIEDENEVPGEGDLSFEPNPGLKPGAILLCHFVAFADHPIAHSRTRYLITPVSVRRFLAQAASLWPESAGISKPKLTV